MADRALTLRLDEATYQRLRRDAFDRETSMAEIIRAALEPGKRENLAFRVIPEPPPNIGLAHIYTLSGAGAEGLRAVWRHGCDAGMVAP